MTIWKGVDALKCDVRQSGFIETTEPPMTNTAPKKPRPSLRPEGISKGRKAAAATRRETEIELQRVREMCARLERLLRDGICL